MDESRSSLSRREFVFGTTALWISASLPRPKTAAAAAAGTAPQTFDATEWNTVEAMTMRILPTDDTPGAAEAGCVNFIDKALAAEDASALPAYRAAVAELNRQCEQRFERVFAELPANRQDAVLRDLERGGFEGWQASEAAPEAFFQTLRMHTILGFLLDPRHGGNRDYVGWKTIGWPGPVHLLGGSQPDQMLGLRSIVPIWERGGPSRHHD